MTAFRSSTDSWVLATLACAIGCGDAPTSEFLGTGILSGSELTFPSQPPGTTSEPLPIVITNTHPKKTVTLTRVETAAPFAVTAPSASVSLAPGGSVAVMVTFSPPAPGTYDGSLICTITRAASQSIPLHGVSDAPADLCAVDGTACDGGTCLGGACVPGVSGLVAHWKFDEGSGTTVADASGGNRPIALVNVPVWTTGKLGGAVQFDGSDDAGETGFAAHLPHWSVSSWVRGATVPSSAKDAGPVMMQENFLIAWDHQNPAFRGAAGLSVGGIWYPASFGTLAAGSWYHLVATYDGETLNAYKDGLLVTSNADPSGDADAAVVPLKIARHAIDPSHFAGAIDETRIYDYALTDTEIAALYEPGGGTVATCSMTSDGVCPASCTSANDVDCPPPPAACTHYVATNGGNASGTGSAGSPWATLSYACGQARSRGNVICVANGSYVDNAQCALAPGVSIRGAGRDATTIDSRIDDIYILGNSWSLEDGSQEVSGFTLRGGDSPTTRQLNGGIRFNRRHNCKVHDMRFQNIEHPAGSDGAAIEYYSDISFDPDNAIPPASWMTGGEIYNVEIFDCSGMFGGDNNLGAIMVNGQEDFRLHDSLVDESHTDGQALKGVYGWLKGFKVYNNIFRVADRSIVRNEYIIFEVWNLCGDSEIYGNKFYNGYLSFVSGQTLGGSHAFTFHDNETYAAGTHEFSVDDIEIYDNYFAEAPDGAWGGGVGLWQTWASAKDEIHNWSLHHNVFFDAHGTAVNVQDKGRTVTFDGVDIYNNVIDGVSSDPWGGSAIDISSSAASAFRNIKIKNNIIMNAADYGVKTTGSGVQAIEVSYNMFSGNRAAIQVSGSTPVTSPNLNAVPQVRGVAPRPDPYYRPSTGSNLIDAGTNVGLSGADSAPDIGAYEHTP